MSHPTRRNVLRGLLGGTAVSVMIPPLEALTRTTPLARAALADDGFPIRFGVAMWGNGTKLDTFWPEQTGPDWVATKQLAPLNSLRHRLTLLSGYEVRVPNVIPHYAGLAGILTGREPAGVDGNESMASATVDQVMAAEIGQDTRFTSLETGARGDKSYSHNAAWSPNPFERDAFALYERLFGVGFRAPGDDSVPDPRIGLRRSVLDVVTDQVSALNAKVSVADRRRLDQHLTGVRALERRLARLLEDPPDLEACVKPDAPPDTLDAADPFANNDAVAELLAMALACDQSRVFFHKFTEWLDNHVYPGRDTGHHRLTHDEPGEQPEVEEITTQIMGGMATFLSKLEAIPEGDTTLLDHCAILLTTDVSLGKTHSLNDFPMMLAGSAGGRLVNGTHIRSASGENASEVTLTLMRACGNNLASWGAKDAATSDSVAALEA